MLQMKKWAASLASLALLVGLGVAQSRADDSTTAPTGKAKVTVTVVDADGKPVAGATVNIAAAPAKGAKGDKAPPATQPDGATRAKPVVIESGVTGADGTFALTKIADGSFTVMARVKGTGNGRAMVTVTNGADQAVSITLKPAKKKAAV